MCLLFSFFPATFWVVIGFFVYFTSTKSEGSVRKFGQILSVWIFILALLILMFGIYVTITGQCPIG